ncbi:MAG: hypothetical protein A3F40_03390 [Chlamydiae bacterium RIFCSPHIGHO2_12_FULL_27_8]|nr:MAG: hypothetical protein A3F40_03390 [Chlamydiae bacterium RIFCSPHIGHO2_12_FULL_27_8]
MHLISRDLVPYIDIKGYLLNAFKCRIMLLEPDKNASILDHSFKSGTYLKPLNIYLNNYKNLFLD